MCRTRQTNGKRREREKKRKEGEKVKQMRKYVDG
jgi:hypothetical protein